MTESGQIVSSWGRWHLRDAPWRRTRDPWAILVSEVMLQQTQFARVIPAHDRFVSTFPSPTHCAEASLAEVITLWAGLGYNRRARNLYRAAIEIRDRHRGRVPDALDALLALPGVGAYTARAVLAFAFEQPVGVVDTNVGRVLARAVAGRPLTIAQAQDLADGLVPSDDPWGHNQAMLELGATVCTSRDPKCGLCPIQDTCAWRAAGLVPPDPASGSAAVSRPQPKFNGSDRQGRGRLISALRHGSVQWSEIPEVIGWPDDRDRARRVAHTLVKEGLAVDRGDSVALPT